MTAFSTIWRGVGSENRGWLRKREGGAVFGDWVYFVEGDLSIGEM
jgi:hypothetical protein